MTLQTPAATTAQGYLDSHPVTRRQYLIVGICVFITLADGFDTQSIAFIGPAIAQSFGKQPTDMAAVITASTVGMTIGAMGLGSVADRIGRRAALVAALAIFGVFSLAASMSTEIWHIVVLRFLIGLGMGGATPALLALVAEFAPLKHRAIVMTITLLGLPGGAMIGGLVAAAWLPVLGWRGIFLVGGIIPVVLIPLALLLLPESPSFLAARGTERDTTKARHTLGRVTGSEFPATTDLITETREHPHQGSVGALFSPAYRRAAITIWGVYLLNWISWFLLLQWLPTALKTLGLDTDTAAMGTVVVNGAFIVMAIPISILLARVNVKRILMAMFATGVVVCVGLGLAGDGWSVVFILIAVAGFGVGGGQLALNYLTAMSFPTELRATATGWAIGIGRTGSIIGSAIGGTILASWGVANYFFALAVPLVLAAALTLMVPARPRSFATLQRMQRGSQFDGG